ncbi:MAG: Maf family nucleotide pyrophosphatase [Gammaproteobacteria bacterium]|nr:Maf family nucleotide pyrophosphatase [Gammaproteobacteria bacterium]
MSRIILASSSPFRKELLSRLQLNFDTSSPDVDESALENETPSELVQRLATKKANAVAEKVLDCICIGSDQVAVCDDIILGKPGTLEKAVEQLHFLSGKRVCFHTGLSVISTKNALIQTDEVKFYVEFRELSDSMIRNYLKKEPAFNCAGSFKSESLGIALTKRMLGPDPTSLIGLPLIRLTEMLEKAGVDII